MAVDVIIWLFLFVIGLKFFRPKKGNKAGGTNGKGIHQ